MAERCSAWKAEGGRPHTSSGMSPKTYFLLNQAMEETGGARPEWASSYCAVRRTGRDSARKLVDCGAVLTLRDGRT